MSGRRVLLAGTVWLLEKGACDYNRPEPFPSGLLDSRIGSAVCSPDAEHGCGSSPPLDCYADAKDYVDASLDRASELGLRYSVDCATREHDDDDAVFIDPNSRGFASCEETCQYFHGDEPMGAECEPIGFRMSACEPNLICGADGLCHDPCMVPLVADLGDYCGVARGLWFERCGPGLGCGAQGICVEGAALDEPCDGAVVCEAGLWCSESGTCQAVLPGGDDCVEHEQCDSRFCAEGACVVPESLTCERHGW